MKQYEAVIKVMQQHGGYSTLGHLYQEALKVPNVKWGTKTPFASIRRIVQDNRFFFKIRPGLWALNDYKDKLPTEIQPAEDTPKDKVQEYNHTYYQGLLVEIGKMRAYEAAVPSQDKNKKFLDKTLGEISMNDKYYEFSYDWIVSKAKTIDVTWFNRRHMPESFFEIEHTTDIKNSMLKFVELQDFNAGLFIVADIARKREFDNVKAYDAFHDIRCRVEFMDYDYVSNTHTDISAKMMGSLLRN